MMKSDTVKEFEKRLWRKVIIYAICMSVFYYILALFLPGYDSNPIWLALFGFLGCLTIPFFMKAGEPSKQKTIWELERIDKDFEESGNELILKTFGFKDFEILYVEEGNWLPINAIDVYRKLIKKEEAKNNPELRFYLFLN